MDAFGLDWADGREARGWVGDSNESIASINLGKFRILYIIGRKEGMAISVLFAQAINKYGDLLNQRFALQKHAPRPSILTQYPRAAGS